MLSCLLLTLALLGTASTSHAAARHPRDVPTAMAKGRFHYAVVTKYQTYTAAQKHCREVLGGELASVHSAAQNQHLKDLARTYTRVSVWIGAVTRRRNGRWGSQWEDGSSWNYSNWAATYPQHLLPTCTTLNTVDGLWRSRPCIMLRPFICQY